MLRDNRGVTLLELLLGTAVSLIVLGVAIALFASIHHATETGIQRYLDKSAEDAVMNLLSAELSDATAAVRHAALNELRYSNGSAARSLVFDPGAKTLTLYEFSEGTPPQAKLANLKNASISLADTPELYTNGRTFPARVTAVAFTDEAGDPLPDGMPVGGTLIRIEVAFEQNEVKINGIRVPVIRTAETMVKLFDDTV